MAVPKKRTSSRKTRTRRAHDGLKAVNLMTCSNCGDPTLPHRACANCGMYKGKMVFEPKE